MVFRLLILALLLPGASWADYPCSEQFTNFLAKYHLRIAKEYKNVEAGETIELTGKDFNFVSAFYRLPSFAADRVQISYTEKKDGENQTRIFTFTPSCQLEELDLEHGSEEKIVGKKEAAEATPESDASGESNSASSETAAALSIKPVIESQRLSGPDCTDTTNPESIKICQKMFTTDPAFEDFTKKLHEPKSGE
jgi:hypothetical protein